MLPKVVDISYVVQNYITLEKDPQEIFNDEKAIEIARKLYDDFSSWGFAYVKGHGIDEKPFFKTALKYFQLPHEEKMKAKLDMGKYGFHFGYLPVGGQIINEKGLGDHKESFDFLAMMPKEMRDMLPEFFEEALCAIDEKFRMLSMCMTRLWGMALYPSEPGFLERCHGILAGDHQRNLCQLRTLKYPSFDGTTQVSMRLAEHIDYSSFTMIAQDETGGLEFECPTTGEFVHAPPITGTLLLMPGEMMERWSSGSIKATRHRVNVTTNNHLIRQSLVYFVAPNNDTVVSCLDGSNKYEPIEFLKYISPKMKDSYT